MKTIIRIAAMLILMGFLWECTRDPGIKTDEQQSEERALSRAAGAGDGEYYWGSKGKIHITRSSNQSYVLFSADAARLTATLKSAGMGAITDIQEYNLVKTENAKIFANLKSGVGKTSDIESLKKLDEVVYAAPFYVLEDGKEFPLTNVFLVELNSPGESGKLEALATENNVNIIERIPLTDNAYVLACTKNSNGNALEMANLFYEKGGFLSSTPEFMSGAPDCVNDTYFPQQWNMRNTGQNGGTTGMDIGLCNVRTLSQGSTAVTIAIVDQGVAANHPDINVDFHHDADTQTNTQKTYGYHGTACAGIFKAKTNNGIGVAGIAPDCKLMSVSTAFSTAAIAYAIRYAADNGAHVISNSWGFSSDVPVINSAIKHALQNGRGGKGCVVVFSAGNNNTPYVNYPKAADPDIIVVGAMAPRGERKSPTSSDGEGWGSNYGDALDVMAPGVLIYTTDIPGSGGRGPGDYHERFNGTSSACPHISGIAALILSLNPGFTQKQVGYVIETTARKVGGYNYSVTTERPNGTWNHEMGYGLVDPYEAVLMAKEMNPNLDIYLKDRTFSGDRSFLTYKWIYAENVDVQKGGKLTLEAGGGVQIRQPFSVHQNASFVMK